ncbi:arabinose-proton symporter [Candidatus Symbiothrix dinenymphae]|nr:arabinose-proton symporter [Candidatus Symbiothrix dinenymphae]
MKKETYQPGLIYVISIIAAMGGLLFGFDTGVISGAIPFFQKDFRIDDGFVEIITSAGLVGAILGALFSGKLTDRIGRRKIILIAAVIFIVGALGSGIAPTVWTLVTARLGLGVAIGISSYAVPLYLAEIAPTKIRGTLVSLFQLMVTIGILLSYISDLYFANEADISCWRPMFYVCAIPAVILFIGIIFLPETPRWLFNNGRSEESLKILKRIESEQNALNSYQQMQEEVLKSSETEKTGWKELWKPWLRIPLIIAVGIMFFQQFVGINTVIYYSPKIFLMAGFNGAVAAIWASVGVGVVTVIFTLVSVYFIDRLGRRKLYFLGMVGMMVSLFLLGLCFAFHGQLVAYQWTYIVCMFCYVAFFSISIGPLGWLIISEIFPQKVRGVGAALGSLASWFFNAAVAFSFFKIVRLLTVPGTEIMLNGENLGNPMGAFWFYGLIAFLSIIWGYRFIPETKGVSLEHIEDFWRTGGKPKELKNNN